MSRSNRSDPPRLQLWSYNYDPEPTGIAPVNTRAAGLLRDRGWEVEVVTAHPHYPEPRWGTRRLPYRETRDGIRLLRLPLWIGRGSAAERLRQEASYAAALLAAVPLLGRPLMGKPDVILAASPSFPALLPAVVSAKARRIPIVLRLHDLLPDGATASGLLEEGDAVLRASRWLERSAYAAAERIVVLSAPWTDNLVAKGVDRSKIELIYDPASRGVPADPPEYTAEGPAQVLCMGNIGFTQGMKPLVRAFEASSPMRELDVRLLITGSGVAAEETRDEIRSERVEMPGLVDDDTLEQALGRATLGLVSQSYEGTEFNLPSKLWNYMAYGLPVIAAVNPRGEVARIVELAGAGWVADSSDPDSIPRVIAAALQDPGELRERGRAAYDYARSNLSLQAFGDQLDATLRAAIRAPAQGSPVA